MTSDLKQEEIPLYHQLKEIFIGKIVSGEWKPGETIPSEVQLCDIYHVNRGPVRQALDQLVLEGLLEARPGEGDRVLTTKIERNLAHFYSFTHLIEQRGMESSTHLLSFQKVSGEMGVARRLNLGADDPIYKFRRLSFADGEPMVLETVYIPLSVTPDLSEEVVQNEPLYNILQNHYGHRLVRARQFFEPVVADEFEAQVLTVRIGAPMLLLQNITYTSEDRPIVLSKNVMRGDRVRYFVELDAIVPAN